MAFNKAKALQEAEKSVMQGKISQAIKQYLDIIDKDPSDLSLLNTIGDLYVREKNVPEGLRHFHRLADAYVQEGFTVKAIAIYKKVAKLDQNTADPLLKLAELYQVQGLGREAREQYFQAAEFYKKKNQSDKALEVLRRIVQLDPENSVARSRLAQLCEQTGRKDEAAQVYLGAAEVALRREDIAAAEPALKKAAELNPQDPQIHLLRARVALLRKRPEEVEKLITSTPELRANPAARQLLLEAYLAAHKLEAAEKLVLEVYRANPVDFAPLASFSALCVEKGNIDAAFKVLSEAADQVIEQRNSGPLMESLRRIWSKSPQHLPTLKLIYRICEQTADEFTLPEILEALGHAYVQAGELEKAEQAYRRLVNREPETEHYKELLKQVLQKQGKEVILARPEDLSGSEMALEPGLEAAEAPVSADAAEAAMVKEALENSDLFSRYHLVEKAVTELEKVLVDYPDQIEIHQRIIEICRRNLPERVAQAAGALARIFTQRGDLPTAKKYEGMAGPQAAPAAVEREAPLAAPAPEVGAKEFALTSELAVGAAEEPAPSVAEEVAPPAPGEVSFDLSAAPVSAGPPAPPAPPTESPEIDLSEDWEAVVAPAAPPEAPAFNYEESRVEINFYLENGFVNEARKAVEELEEKFPGHEQVAELRRLVETHVGAAAPEPAPTPSAPPAQPSAAEWELPSAYVGPPSEAPPVSAEEPEAPKAASPPPIPEAPPPVEPAPAVAAAGGELLGDLAGDLASTLDGLAARTPPPTPAPPTARPTGEAASPLSGLLEELGEPAGEVAGPKDDRETHYNLGVAFREMGLLDEAIGEFQKVVKGAGKGKFPPNFLQACSLLALCFMEKKMPAVAVKWYLRALEAPSLDEEATLALQYDLGVAYEQVGDTRTALEKFTEVYSQNIDYRDVAEKIRVLSQKVS